MSVSKEEGLGVDLSILWHPYSNSCNCLCSIKNMTYTHIDVTLLYYTFQFLVNLVYDEAYTDMSLNPSFREMKHRTHFQ